MNKRWNEFDPMWKRLQEDNKLLVNSFFFMSSFYKRAMLEHYWNLLQRESKPRNKDSSTHLDDWARLSETVDWIQNATVAVLNSCSQKYSEESYQE